VATCTEGTDDQPRQQPGGAVHCHRAQLSAIDTDSDTVTVEGETVDLDNLGHISTKTGSIPMGVSYGPGAVEESPLVGVSPDSHVETAPGSDGSADAGGDD